MRFVTIVARNYLAGARVLARSLLIHEGVRLVVVVADLQADDYPPDDDFDVVTPEQLPIPVGELQRMALIYTVTEFSTALKPFALQWVLDQGAPSVVYLDPDMLLYAPLSGLAGQLKHAQVVLTPHVLYPLPRDGKETSEYTLRRCGIFNLGFIAVAQNGRPFLDWFQERLLRDAISDPVEMLYTDQKWADWVPALFTTAVWRDPGVNVAYWNLHERQPVITSDGAVACLGTPLRLFHFSGFDPARPDVFSSRPGASYRVPEVSPAVRDVTHAYAEAMLGAGSTGGRALPYAYAATPHGYALTLAMRRATRAETVGAEAAGLPLPPTPFTDENAFAHWLAEPVPCAGDFAPRALVIEFGAVHGKPVAEAPGEVFLQWMDSDHAVEEVARYGSWAAALGLPPLSLHRGEVTPPRGAGRRNAAGQMAGVPRRIIRRIRRTARLL